MAVSDEDLDALVCYVDEDQMLRQAYTTFGALRLAAAVPRLDDAGLVAAVHIALAKGLFKHVEPDRLSFSLEGRRRARTVRARLGTDDAFGFDWTSIPDFTLADAILVEGNDVSKHRMALWIEDLYVAFGSTDIATLKGAVVELRERALLARIDVVKTRPLTKRGYFAGFDHEWASVFTRNGQRRAVLLRERKDVSALKTPRAWSNAFEHIKEIGVDADVTAFFRAIPRGLRELSSEHRHNGRPGFIVQDEYDLQDFVRAYLRMRYPMWLKEEESTPSSAGKGGRVDFLIEGLHCLIELKVFRDEAYWKSTMLPDIASKIERYGRDARCHVFYVFIFDPDRKFRNAALVEAEMSNERTIGGKLFHVKVVVAPQN